MYINIKKAGRHWSVNSIKYFAIKQKQEKNCEKSAQLLKLNKSA